MKRTIVLLATLLLSFGLTNAANVVDIDVGGVGFAEDTIRTRGQVSRLEISIENDYEVFGMSLGFQIWSPDGATWAWGGGPQDGGAEHVVETEDVLPLPPIVVPNGTITTMLASRLGNGDDVFEMTKFLVTQQNVDEADRDTIMCGGVAMSGGLTTGPLEHMYNYYFAAGGDGGDDGWVGTLCFDSSFVPPSGAFVFVNEGGGANPPDYVGWQEGGICHPVAPPRNFCPAFDGGIPIAMSVDHCGSGQVTLTATDPEGDAITFGLGGNTGGGTAVVSNNGDGSCDVTYTPVPADVGAAITITVDVWDAFHAPGSCTPHDIAVTVTNNAPTISCGAAYNAVGKGNDLIKADIVGSDVDGCDVLSYALVSEDPPFAIGGAVDAVTGVYTVGTDDGGADNGSHTVCVSVTDGFETVECCFEVDVLPVEPWEIAIEKAHDVLQGHFVDLNVCINKGSEAIGGFDFLIGYDASALAFTEATLGDWLISCRWEYFTYRFNWNGNCGNGCPSGLLRVVGMAETNNGPNHPDTDCLSRFERGEDCYDCGTPIVVLTFFVSNDRTLECQFAPVRFYWMDCGDNTISTLSGDTLAINRYIYDIGSCQYSQIEDWDFGLPGYYGAPNDPCMDGDKVTPVRFIDFCNGGIDIVCADSIDARGDINVNGLPNEIADAVMFTNYFISGLSAFGTHVEASIAASDVNADGIALSVADLVYLVRVIVGDANPYPKPLPETPVTISAQGGRISYDSPVDIGAALLTFQVNGDIGSPQLGTGAANMDIKYAVDGNQLRVLVYNIGSEMIAAGSNELVTVPGNVELTGAEVATFDGFGVDALVRNLPMHFEVKNYPNPFNPSTTLSVALPNASDWSIKIYNIAGQVVTEYSGHSDAGTVEVVWNGTDRSGDNVASGIYFYKVQAGQYTATKKMLLMK